MVVQMSSKRVSVNVHRAFLMLWEKSLNGRGELLADADYISLEKAEVVVVAA